MRAAVALSLKDGFSQGIKSAGAATRAFADGAKQAIAGVDKAFSGAMGALSAVGVSFSVGSAVNEIVKFDNHLTRIGLTADASKEQIDALKKKIYNTAQLPDIKVDTTSIADALDVVMTKTGNLEYSEANIRNIATAIKATGESGEAIGSVFAEFQKFGYTADQITKLMDDMVKQGDQGAFTFGEFAKAGSAVISAYSPIGTAPDDIKRANAAMQIIMMGTKNAEIAVTALSSTMAELSSPDKQQKLMAIGVRVRDESGKFRDFNDIMADLLKVSEKVGNTDFLGNIFGQTSMQAIRAYSNFYDDMYPRLMDLGDTSGAMNEKAARMAGTLSSNLENLKTAFVAFADANLTKPLEHITELLNKLAENPAKLHGVFAGVAASVAAIGAIKLAPQAKGIFGFFQKALYGGGKVSAEGTIDASIGGQQGMPVYVTNWGGAAVPGSPIQQDGTNPLTPNASSSPIPQGVKGKLAFAGKSALRGAGTGAALAAVEAVPQALGEIYAARTDDNLSKEQKNRATGGAVGAAVGKIGGAAAGMAAGAAIGSVIPVIGTVIGGALGAGIGALAGHFAGKAGRNIGESIGTAVTKKEERDGYVKEAAELEDAKIQESSLPPELTEQYSAENPQYSGATANLDGTLDVNMNVTVKNDSVKVDTEVARNTTKYANFNTGSAVEARNML